MSNILKDKVLQMYKSGMSKRAISVALSMPRSTVRHWLNGVGGGIEISDKEPCSTQPTVDEITVLKDQLRTLQAQVNSDKKDSLNEHYIREKIIKLTSIPSEAPSWLVDNSEYGEWEAVPTLLASDWHWGENIDPDQIGGVNKYNLVIANDRARAFIETSIRLLNTIDDKYPGIVFALGGDMFSGNIHEELTNTNEKEIMPTFIDLYGVLLWCIKTLHEEFGKVFIPCVTGNHSRTTYKVPAKSRNYTNFDWLMYCMLEKAFEDNKDITFQIPNGPDALYKIFGTKYLLTHGDQFRGGDGMIGALGPILRGDHKKRSRNNQIEMGYDVMVMGHWHQLIQMQRLIVNGSLCGYNEYCYNNNFGYEQPRQALWLTHKEHGIVMSMPINVDRNHDKKLVSNNQWVSWKK